MPSSVIDTTIAQVQATDTVIDSAVALINGVGGMIADAVGKAMANGATAAELQPVNDVVNTLKAKTDELAAAVTANTPAANP